MKPTTDNRWSAGASYAAVPLDRAAYYNARWIDLSYGRADIVPDRQGFAYDDIADRDALMDLLTTHDPAAKVFDRAYDITVAIHQDDEFEVWARRCGGYVYVDAWLTKASPAQPSTESTAQCEPPAPLSASCSSETSTATPTS